MPWGAEDPDERIRVDKEDLKRLRLLPASDHQTTCRDLLGDGHRTVPGVGLWAASGAGARPSWPDRLAWRSGVVPDRWRSADRSVAHPVRTFPSP
jgi:hypothetical protein